MTLTTPGENDAGPAKAIVEWCRRAAALIPLSDRLVLLSPPLLLAKFALYAMSGRKREALADDPDARNPELVDLLIDLFR